MCTAVFRSLLQTTLPCAELCILLRAYYGDYDSAVAVAVAAQFGWKRYRFTITRFRDHVGFSYLLFACQCFPVLVATSQHLHHHNCVWTRLLGSFSAPVFSTVCLSVSVCLWRAHLMAKGENCAETPSSFFSSSRMSRRSSFIQSSSFLDSRAADTEQGKGNGE